MVANANDSYMKDQFKNKPATPLDLFQDQCLQTHASISLCQFFKL